MPLKKRLAKVSGCSRRGWTTYLIGSSMSSDAATIENYRRTADEFTNAAEDCKKVNTVFGYHNH